MLYSLCCTVILCVKSVTVRCVFQMYFVPVTFGQSGSSNIASVSISAPVPNELCCFDIINTKLNGMFAFISHSFTHKLFCYQPFLFSMQTTILKHRPALISILVAGVNDNWLCRERFSHSGKNHRRSVNLSTLHFDFITAHSLHGSVYLLSSVSPAGSWFLAKTPQ